LNSFTILVVFHRTIDIVNYKHSKQSPSGKLHYIGWCLLDKPYNALFYDINCVWFQSYGIGKVSHFISVTYIAYCSFLISYVGVGAVIYDGSSDKSMKKSWFVRYEIIHLTFYIPNINLSPFNFQQACQFYILKCSPNYHWTV
jgi:hypothetical protein